VGGKLINNVAYMMPHRFDQFGNLPDQFARCEDYPKAGAVNAFILYNDCSWAGCELR